MNVPVPWSSLVGAVQGVYGYFRTGIAVEGEARLCENAHLLIYAGGEWPKAPQHVDVRARFWLRRGGRVTVLEVADARILSRERELAVASWSKFPELTLEVGGKREEVSFELVPAGASDDRVEAAVGEVLVVEFRPSRGSERFARPRLQVRLGLPDSG